MSVDIKESRRTETAKPPACLTNRCIFILRKMITITFKTLSGRVGHLRYNQRRVTLKRVVRDYNQSTDLGRLLENGGMIFGQYEYGSVNFRIDGMPYPLKILDQVITKDTVVYVVVSWLGPPTLYSSSYRVTRGREQAFNFWFKRYSKGKVRLTYQRIRKPLNKTCAICMDRKPTNCTMSCGHGYHVSCISNWQERSMSCPMCRKYAKIDISSLRGCPTDIS